MELGKNIRKDFPIFARNKDAPFVYLDSAATALKPTRMIDAMREYYESYSANVSRGVYPMSERATEAYEKSRDAIARFIGADRPEEIIFVRNATEAINLLAMRFGDLVLHEGDGILLSETCRTWRCTAQYGKCHKKYYGIAPVLCEGTGF